MKKLILSFAFIGLFSFMTPMDAAPLPPSTGCYTAILDCGDGDLHYVVICDDTDWSIWGQLLCGYSAE